MRRCETSVFGVALEELQEKHGVGPKLQIFFIAGVAGAGCVWHDMLVELLEFLEWNSAKHASIFYFFMCARNGGSPSPCQEYEGNNQLYLCVNLKAKFPRYLCGLGIVEL